jgi:hypothetical protein
LGGDEEIPEVGDKGCGFGFEEAGEGDLDLARVGVLKWTKEMTRMDKLRSLEAVREARSAYDVGRVLEQAHLESKEAGRERARSYISSGYLSPSAWIQKRLTAYSITTSSSNPNSSVTSLDIQPLMTETLTLRMSTFVANEAGNLIERSSLASLLENLVSWSIYRRRKSESHIGSALTTRRGGKEARELTAVPLNAMSP